MSIPPDDPNSKDRAINRLRREFAACQSALHSGAVQLSLTQVALANSQAVELHLAEQLVNAKAECLRRAEELQGIYKNLDSMISSLEDLSIKSVLTAQSLRLTLSR